MRRKISPIDHAWGEVRQVYSSVSNFLSYRPWFARTGWHLRRAGRIDFRISNEGQRAIQKFFNDELSPLYLQIVSAPDHIPTSKILAWARPVKESFEELNELLEFITADGRDGKDIYFKSLYEKNKKKLGALVAYLERRMGNA